MIAEIQERVVKDLRQRQREREEEILCDHRVHPSLILRTLLLVLGSFRWDETSQ